MEVHFIDVDQGDATLLKGPGFTLLIDAGRHDRRDVVPYLRSAGVEKIDLLVGTHPHADHIGQFPQVLAAFDVEEVWLSGEAHPTATFERALDAILASDAAYYEPRTGDVFAWGPARVEVLNPSELTGDVHEGSISLRVVYGEVAFVFTGDAETHTEMKMVESGLNLRAHGLHLGHHGSRTSTAEAFVLAVAPEFAVYSAGAGNTYGHPHAEVIARLERLGLPVYGTDVHGTIVVKTDGFSYEIFTERSGALAASCIDVNTASVGELTEIVHIGPARAQALIENRPYASLDDLIRVPGIGASRLRDILEQGAACVGG